MLYVTRNPPPRAGQALQSEINKLEDYIEQLRSNRESGGDVIRISKGFHTRSIKELDSRWYDILQEQFEHKCAYCETYVGNEGVVDHFRPTNGVKNFQLDTTNNFNDNLSDLYYIWLAYEWSNIFLACKECVSNKGNYFPVEGKRTGLYLDTRRERPLLIDPCKEYPEEHLYYSSEGLISAKSKKGEITIKLLGLNRLKLVELRKIEIDRIRLLLTEFRVEDTLLDLHINDLFNQIPSSIFKQQLAEWIMNLESTKRIEIFRFPYWKTKLKILYGNFQTTKQLTDKIREYTVNSSNYIEITGPFTQAQRIEQINITNIRGISFEHSFLRQDKNESWLMILGENGTGKTTILKAIAMALTVNWSDLGIKASSFTSSEIKAEIVIKLEGDQLPTKVIFREKDVEHINPPAPMPVIAYGAIRLIPSRFRRSKTSLTSWHNVKNLFSRNASNYFVNHPIEWLEDQETIHQIAKVILEVLPFENNEKVDMIILKGKAFIEIDGVRIAFHELSSGYQSVIALITDICRSLHKTSGLRKFSEGIVLIDELDSHLHPSWKMMIVSKLRSAFPYMQFIVTSHDPLCLRGTQEGEVVVLKRSRNEVSVIKQLPNQEGLRIDQILTSEFFNMSTTNEPEVDNLIRQYQKLLSSEELSQDDHIELMEIERRLDSPSIKYLGYTTRERLMYKVIDEFIADRKKNMRTYNELDEATKQKLLQLWDMDEVE